mgnify:CR=1 FL=1
MTKMAFALQPADGGASLAEDTFFVRFCVDTTTGSLSLLSDLEEGAKKVNS